MNKTLLVGAIAGTLILMGCNKEETAPQDATVTVETTIEKVSYGIGLNLAKNFKMQNMNIDMTAFNAGLDDGRSGAEGKLDNKAIMEAMESFQKEQMIKQAAERSALEEVNKTKGAKYLATNAAKEGVVTTESGLQYLIITAVEKGAKPTAEDTVVVHYRGTLINGEEFDSSYSRNQSATFGVGQVIPGWTEALQLMKVGEKFSLTIPSELAYGASGAGPNIGPNAVLNFEVELIEIKGEEKSEMVKEGMHEEGMHEEGMHEEGMHEEGMHEEGMHEEGMNKEGMNKEGMNKEGMNKEGMNKEGMAK